MIIVASKAKETSTPAAAKAVEEGDGAAAETILLIHGTSANRHSDHADWWHPGSDFCSKLDALLKNEGVEARCWAHLRQIRAPTRSLPAQASAPFAWSGANSERDRHGAGRALAAELARIESDPAVKRYHLIGHSHGGNVMLHALRMLPYSPKKLGEAVFLGTPVLSFRHREALDLRWIAVPIYIAALGACIWAFQRGADDRIYSGTAALAIVIALVADLLQSKRHSRRPAAQLYGSGRPSAFVFGCDEAVQALESAQQVARHPKRFIDQFIARKEPPRYAFDPTPVPQPTFESQIEGTGAYAMLRVLQPPPQPALPGARCHRSGAGHNSSRKRERSTAIGGQGHRRRDCGVSVQAGADRNAVDLRGAASVADADCLGALPLSGSRGERRRWPRGLVRRKLVRRVGVTGAGAQGGDGRGLRAFPRIAAPAPAVAKCEELSEPLLTEATAVNCRSGQDAGQAMTQALVANDAFAIKSYVEHALTNSALAHSHYYKATEIQTRIAQLIATPAPKIGLALPSWLATLRPVPFGTWINNPGSGTPTSASLDK